jgi:hypothetical protein
MKPEDIQRENEAAALSARWVIVWLFRSLFLVGGIVWAALWLLG